MAILFPTVPDQKYILWGFILLKFFLQYLAIDQVYELHRDEYLHLDLGKHLAWGYSSVPPVTGLLSWLIVKLGNSVFLVKFFPALFGALTLVVVWKTVKFLGGGTFALILSATCILFSALLRVNTLYQPNSLEYLMWTLVFYYLVRYTASGLSRWLWLAAVSFAIGFLNKYNITFLLIGLTIGIFLSPARSLLRSRQLFYATGLALILVMPTLIWQFLNGFPVFHHLQQLSDNQLAVNSWSGFLIEQLFFFTGSLLIILLGLISFFSHSAFRKYVYIFWSYLIIIAMYSCLKAKGYYAIGLYPILIAFGSAYLEKLLQTGWVRYLRPLAIALPVLSFLPVFSLVLPVLPPESIIAKSDQFEKHGLLRWEDGQNHTLPQDFADMLGWRELAARVDSALNLVPDKKSTLIHCDNYGQAGAINYYSKNKYYDAVSMHADYIKWYPLDEMEIKHVILVQQANDTDPGRERERNLFENVLTIGAVENIYAREYGTKVYLLEYAKQSINDILQEEMNNKDTDH